MEFGRSNNKIIIILGPTSSGKSDLAIKIAQKYNGEIISADSRQIYREMNIGTGKITKTEQKLAKHHMIDIVSPKTNFSVAQFKKKTEKIIKDILKRGRLPIICGGTGFWIKSIIDDVEFPEVKPDWKLREKLGKYHAEKLFSMLKKLDSKRAGNIDARNKVRLIRAIEICKSIGRVPALLCHPELDSGSKEISDPMPTGRQEVRNDKRWIFLQIGISMPREKLNERIKIRLAKRFKQGMIKEVKKLHEQGLSWKKIESFGLGYFWIPRYLKGKLSKKEVFEKTYQAEKDYAKRQMTWFQKDKRIKWIKNHREAEKIVIKFL